MKKNLFPLLMAALLGSGAASGAMITNGDFADCTLNGWSTDSDLTPGSSSEISVVNTGTQCYAEIGIDNTFAFSNILYQEMDLTAAAGSEIWLDLNFGVDSELTNQAPGSADYFSVYLSDGLGNAYDHTLSFGGMYDFVDINGQAQYSQSFLIDSSIYNQSGWFLEFQVATNFDGAPSSMQVYSAALNEVSSVPAPATLPLVLLSAAGFISLRQRKAKGATHA